jgi:hypothetical protein
MALKMGGEYIEVHIRQHVNVDEVFTALIRKLLAERYFSLPLLPSLPPYLLRSLLPALPPSKAGTWLLSLVSCLFLSLPFHLPLLLSLLVSLPLPL